MQKLTMHAWNFIKIENRIKTQRFWNLYLEETKNLQ